MLRPIAGIAMIFVAVGAISGTLDKFPGGMWGGLILAVAGVVVLSCGLGGTQSQH